VRSKSELVKSQVGIHPREWEIKKIEQFANVRTGPFGSLLHQDDYVQDGTPIITVEHLGYRGIIHENLPMVSDKDKQRLSAYLLRKHDIVFSRVGSVDRNSIVKKDEEGWLFSGRLLRIRTGTNDVYSPYLSYYFSSESFKNRIRNVAVGQTMASLNTKIMNNIEVVLPPKNEQRAIAEVLSDVDALIEAQEALIEKKRLIKQGVMQALLTGKRRVPGFNKEWEKLQLSEIISYEQPGDYKIRIDKPKSKGLIPVLTPGKTFILGYTDDDTGIYDNLPVILFDDFTTTSRYVDFPFKVDSSAVKFLTTKTSDFDLRFIYEKMQTIKFEVGNHKRYYISEYQDLMIYVPDISEQKEISEISIDMDIEIAVLEELLQKYKLIKQGMMQELLTGRTRLL